MRFFKKIFLKIKKAINIYKFIFHEIQKSSKFLLYVLLISTLFTGLIPVVLQYLMKVIVSYLENRVDFSNFIFIVFVYLFIILFKDSLLSLKEYINNLSVHRLVYNIQTMLIEKIKKIDYKVFYSPIFQNSYNIVLQNSQNELSDLLFTSIQSATLIVQLIITAAIIVRFNPMIIFLMILSTIPSFFLNVSNEKNRINIIEQRSLSYRKMLYYFSILTSLPFIKEIKVFNLHAFILKKRDATFHNYLKAWRTFGIKEMLKKFYSEIIPFFCTLISILLVIFNIIHKSCFISDFLFLSGIIFSFKEIASIFALSISKNYRCFSFVNKLIDFLNNDNEIKSGCEKVVAVNDHVLEFKNVYFKYPYSEKYSLKNINFRITAGEKISLVGQNGCGKTTLINLILRLYEPTEGEILLDGINIKEYDYQDYLKLFSAVFQDYQPYSFKLLDYISSGNAAAMNNLFDIKKAAINTTADQFIEKTPLKWESNLTTLFDKNGLELSGGQWQKLAVAKAFYYDAPILILDEPTSAMDSFSESRIYESIKNMENSKIIIFVSHRMYSSKMATKVIYMENGEIKNIGSHDELVKKSSGYKKLFEEQANKY